MNPLDSARFLISVAAPPQFPPDVGVEVAFAGRSNAGKSTAINTILRHRALARASKAPGRTRLVNYFALGRERANGGTADVRLVDLPGYGYAEVPAAERRHWVGLLEALAARRSFSGLMLLVDARRGLLAEDEQLISWAVAGNATTGVPTTGAPAPARRVHVLLSKADKLARSAAQQVFAQTTLQLGGRATVQLFSATAGTGVLQARRLLESWLTAPPRG